MGRIKYDIWVRPFLDTDRYEIRITNKDALAMFMKIAVNKGVYKPNMVIHRLNEWHSLTPEMFNAIQYGVWISDYIVKIEYASLNHLEHGLKTV